MQKTVVSWSSGKDAALALYRLIQSGTQPQLLLTTVTEEEQSVTAHGISALMVQAQAAALGLPLQQVIITSGGYEAAMSRAYQQLSISGYTSVVFGDIFLQNLKQYRQAQLKQHNIEPIFPLWGCDSKLLMREFLAAGFKAIVVCVNSSLLPQHFCGRLIDEEFVADLPPGVDVCGENGEYHSFVFDGPLFTHPVQFIKSDTLQKILPAPKDVNATNGASQTQIPFFYTQLMLL